VLLFVTNLQQEHSLRGRHIEIAAESWMPWFKITETESGDISFDGVMFDVLGYLQESINFTYVIVRPTDKQWGVCNKQGNCNGMVGMVQRMDVDLALGK
jgi:hypothetical protein